MINTNKKDKKMTQVKLENKLNPEPPFEVMILDKEPVEVTNAFSGEKAMLNPTAVAVYDMIKGAEMFGDYDKMEKGLDWFMRHYPKEYVTLLD
jgi:hypothetical protein